MTSYATSNWCLNNHNQKLAKRLKNALAAMRGKPPTKSQKQSTKITSKGGQNHVKPPPKPVIKRGIQVLGEKIIDSKSGEYPVEPPKVICKSGIQVLGEKNIDCVDKKRKAEVVIGEEDVGIVGFKRPSIKPSLKSTLKGGENPVKPPTKLVIKRGIQVLGERNINLKSGEYHVEQPKVISKPRIQVLGEKNIDCVNKKRKAEVVIGEEDVGIVGFKRPPKLLRRDNLQLKPVNDKVDKKVVPVITSATSNTEVKVESDVKSDREKQREEQRRKLKEMAKSVVVIDNLSAQIEYEALIGCTERTWFIDYRCLGSWHPTRMEKRPEY